MWTSVKYVLLQLVPAANSSHHPHAWSSSPPFNKIHIFWINAISSHSWLYKPCQCCLNGKTEHDSTLFMNCYLNFLSLFPFPYFVLLQRIFHLFKKEVSFLFFLFLSFAGFYTPLCVVIPQCSIKCIENPFSLLCVYYFFIVERIWLTLELDYYYEIYRRYLFSLTL